MESLSTNYTKRTYPLYIPRNYFLPIYCSIVSWTSFAVTKWISLITTFTFYPKNPQVQAFWIKRLSGIDPSFKFYPFLIGKRVS